MAFMDAIKKAEGQSMMGEKKGFPKKTFLKPSIGGEKKSFIKPVAKETEVVATAEEVTEETTPLTTNEVAPVEVEAIEEVMAQPVEEVVEEATAETTTEVSEPIEEVVKEVAEEKAVEVVEKVEVVEEKAEEVQEAAVEEPVKKEEPPKKPRKRASKKEEPVEMGPIENYTTQMSFEEALEAIKYPFENEEFEAMKLAIKEESNAIVISEDMNSIDAKRVSAQIAELHQKVWFDAQAVKTLYENLTAKDIGLIDVARKAAEEGANESQRKRAGIVACTRYIPAGSDEPINLFELSSYAREQYNFYTSVMSCLDFKKNVMISMNAALKIESNVLDNGGQLK